MCGRGLILPGLGRQGRQGSRGNSGDRKWAVKGANLFRAIVAILTAGVGLARAQGFFLLTDETQPFPLVRIPIAAAAGSEVPIFRVEFGFASQEGPTAGQLHDSVTLSLGGFLDGNDRVLATLDVFGLTLNPRFGNGGDLADGAIAAVPSIPDSRLPALGGHREAVELSFQIPSGWSGSGDLAAFLASNGDNALSAAYIRQPVFVPEPAVVLLSITGGWVIWLYRRRKGGLA